MPRIAALTNGSLALLVLAAGCGGGGSSSRAIQRAVTLALEGPALTDSKRTTLNGTTDPRAAIVELSADGTLASSVDGFATFGIEVVLDAGDNAFTIEALDERGRRRLFPAPPIRLESPLLFGTSGVARVPSAITTTGTAIATLTSFPDQLFLVDPETGERTLASGADRGAGPGFFSARDVTSLGDGSHVLVIGQFANWWRVDLATGDRTLIEPSGFDAHDAADDPTRARIAWIDIAFDLLKAIDPDTLVETLVSDGNDGFAPAMSFPIALEYDPFGDRYIVLDGILPGVLAVDPDDGTRKLLSDFDDAAEGPLLPDFALLAIAGDRKLAWTIAQPSGDLIEIKLNFGTRRVALPGDAAFGPSLAAARGLAVLDDSRLVAAVGDGLVLIDLAANRRSELARTRLGTGRDLPIGFFQVHPVFDRRRGRLLFVDPQGGIEAVDLATGDRSVVLDGSDPGAPFRASDLFLDDATGRCFALADDFETLAELDPKTFEAKLVSSPTVGAGDPLDGALAVVADVPRGRAFVVGGSTPRRIAVVDLATGDRTTLAAPGDGGAVPLQTLLDVEYDPVMDRVFATDLSLSALVVIDPATGERTLLSEHADPSVPPIDSLRLFLDPADHSLYGSASLSGIPDAVVRIDLDTRIRTLVSGDAVGRGPALRRIDQVAGDAANGRLWLFDSSFRGLVQVDLASGDRVIVSR